MNFGARFDKWIRRPNRQIPKWNIYTHESFYKSFICGSLIPKDFPESRTRRLPGQTNIRFVLQSHSNFVSRFLHTNVLQK